MIKFGILFSNDDIYIPQKVRARLAPVIKLSFVGPGRKIIKEGDPPSTVYFILSGEVELYRRVYDRVSITNNFRLLSNT